VARTSLSRIMAIVLATAALSVAAAPVAGALVILTPAGTKVALALLDPVDTAQAATGDVVRFRVAADVVVNGRVVIRSGTRLVGTVDKVGHPFPQNAGFANIGALAVRAVDKRIVRLHDVRVSAPLLGGNIRLQPGALLATSTMTDVTVRVP
jgi:hypothetical protein